ncbi:MAG: hypothetical protein IPO00_03510 [Betaproteobacteria bacterium]|nr:hypothetical protein [Betaproteobacteria bacterium]
MSDHFLVIQSADVKSFDEAYVYGTYSSMSWLKERIDALKEHIKNSGPVLIADHGSCETVDDLKDWVTHSFPELNKEIHWY